MQVIAPVLIVIKKSQKLTITITIVIKMIRKDQAETMASAWESQKNEIYNNKDKEKCPDCGYIKDGTACRKKCKGETGGRYSWLFFIVILIISYYYFKL